VAKRDIKAGEKIDGIGGYCVRGVLETHADMKKNGNVPIGLVGGTSVAKRDIKDGPSIFSPALISRFATATVSEIGAPKGTMAVYHILFRPYHLCSLETPLTIARAVLEHDTAIVPLG
jgi:predicted homoserine dehydrogenase-like protein